MNTNEKTLDQLLAAIDKTDPEEIRAAYRASLLYLYATDAPVYNDDTGEDEDRGERLIFDGEQFPSGADFIDAFLQYIPETIADALP